MNDIAINIWINGRFLTRKITGVERVAMELICALSRGWLSDQGTMEHRGKTLVFRIAVPQMHSHTVPSNIGHIPVVPVGKLDGHLWEQWDLARLPYPDWVINLCNTGSVARGRQGFMFHDAQVYAIPQNFKWAFRNWYRVLLQLGGRRARFLLTNSKFSRNELVCYTGIPGKRWNVMYLGCDHSGKSSGHIPAEIEVKLPRSPFVLAVSSASPNKNFDAVVRALASMGTNAPHCVVVGQSYSKVFSDLGLDEQHVTRLGYVSDDTLAALYERALCLVYPSIYEGFGLPPLEAMSRGCPVITSQTSSMPEVCADAALYCDPHDPATLAAAIARLMNSPTLALEMRGRGLAHAAQFTWHASAVVLMETLFSAIEGQAPGIQFGRSSNESRHYS